ncbi:Uncharacterised protein [Mycobacteroides abscessus subsp. abscessus]|nr:Uncharacterised protein [Mycobacteroides abscessus subsp. abscessus]
MCPAARKQAVLRCPVLNQAESAWAQQPEAFSKGVRKPVEMMDDSPFKHHIISISLQAGFVRISMHKFYLRITI